MQIDFTPHKIKAAKAYLETLSQDKKSVEKEIKKEEKKPSFFRRYFSFLFR